MIDPIKHPKRYAKLQERILAERIRALAPAIGVTAIAERIGMSRPATEELCARHAIPFTYREKTK